MIEKIVMNDSCPVMFPTVVSSSMALCEHGSYCIPVFPRRNLKPRASRRHSPYQPSVGLKQAVQLEMTAVSLKKEYQRIDRK